MGKLVGGIFILHAGIDPIFRVLSEGNLVMCIYYIYIRYGISKGMN